MAEYGSFKPITGDEWEKRLEQAIKDVVSKLRPGDTCQDYVRHVAGVSYGLPPGRDE